MKHFRVEVESGDLVLGEHRFSDLESFQEHFAKLPSLGDGTGIPQHDLTMYKLQCTITETLACRSNC